MQTESPAVQERYRGILIQIDPERFEVQGATTAAVARFTPVDGAASPAMENADWPQLHGPARDSVCREKGLLQEWPEEGPELAWTLAGLGRGYSSIAISRGTIFTMGDRVVEGDERQLVIACDLNSRKELWATPVGPPHPDGGPRSTPTVDGDRVYAIGNGGGLSLLGRS